MRAKKGLLITYVVLLVLLGLVVYAYFVSLLVQDRILTEGSGDKSNFADFICYYNGALLSRHCLLEHRLDIYDPAIQDASMRSYLPGYNPTRPFYLQYPPWFFAFMLPWSFMDVRTAFVVWNIASVVVFAIALSWLFKNTNFSVTEKRVAALAIAVSFPVWLSLRLGQQSLFNFGLVIACIAALQSSRYLRAAVIGALITLKLQYAPAFFVIGACVGRMRFALPMVLCVALFALAAMGVLGVDNVIGYPHSVLTAESKQFFGVWPERMQNIRGYSMLLFPTPLAMKVGAAGFLAGLGGLVWMWRSAAPDRRHYKLLVSISLIVIVMTSLHTHYYDYVLTIISCVWLWDWIRDDESKTRRVAIQTLILIAPIAAWIAVTYSPTLRSVYVQPFFLWALALMGLSIHSWVSRNRSSASTSEIASRIDDN